MCGIAGIFSPYKLIPDDIKIVSEMNILQKHRGPDDQGMFNDKFCVLGHRRLAIIDLSKDGHQPFQSDDKRFYLIYNGEIYNYIELRTELQNKGWRFKTKTDTEVLLKSFLEYGERCLYKLNGMFSFAIYDSLKHVLFLARDRVGVKPLYYLILNSKLYFASEIKAFKAIPKLTLTLNYQTLFDYFCFNRTDIYDETFMNEIKRFPKGHFAHYYKNSFKIIKWWNSQKYINNHIKEKPDQIYKNIEKLFISAVSLRMRSDVPVGSSLSGGLDSSILIGVIFKHNKLLNEFKTFTTSFPNTEFDELGYINCLNKKYEFKNFRTYPTAETAFNNLKDFVYVNDEPTTNSSFYAQYEIMRLAKQNKVTVLLNGQGGDENFAGYHYFHGFHLYGLLRKLNIPRVIVEFFNIIARNQHKSAYQTLIFQILPDALKKRFLLETLPFINKDFFYEYIVKSKIYNEFFKANSLNQSLSLHFQYKIEHLLRMEDRNSMAFAIETRVPYLDYRIIEYLLGINEEIKIKNGETKYLQKKALGKYTIKEILERKDKMGFETPIDSWMTTPKWENLSLENFELLKDFLPDIFYKNSDLPKGGMKRWKINQLATWANIWFK